MAGLRLSRIMNQPRLSCKFFGLIYMFISALGAEKLASGERERELEMRYCDKTDQITAPIIQIGWQRSSQVSL